MKKGALSALTCANQHDTTRYNGLFNAHRRRIQDYALLWLRLQLLGL